MKRLYDNIEDIYIKGGIEQLSEVVTTMDMSLQNIADKTDLLVGYLIKHNTSNAGAQYQNVVSNSLALRDTLFEASIELNDMQKQIVDYQNKIYRYEGMMERAGKPNQYIVSKRYITIDSSNVKMVRSDMIELITVLREYREQVYFHLKTIKEKKNSIAAVWCDTQYDDFAEFIDGVTKNVVDAMADFDNYVLELEEKIKELS